jgi:GGDEF domain-containing protein
LIVVIRQQIKNHEFDKVGRRISVSIGVSGMPDEAENEEKLIRCAICCTAQQLGRNRLVTAGAIELRRKIIELPVFSISSFVD